MKKIFLVAALLLVACGDDAGYESPALNQVRTCIERGGDPKYTTVEGHVKQFLGCVER